MATSDHIKGLFRAFSKRDDPAFLAVANDLIVEEKQKGHPILARDLESILSNGNGGNKNHKLPDDLPTDKERRDGHHYHGCGEDPLTLGT